MSQSALIEGLDEALFDKLTVIEGDISPLFQKNDHAIAVAVNMDDYGNLDHAEFYPPVGSRQIITYIDEGIYLDSRTGEPCDENIPMEDQQFQITASHEVEYTVCAYVIVPYSMSFRYSTTGYSFVLPWETYKQDSQSEGIPLFYLFDTSDEKSEAAAEAYLDELTADEFSGLMYESKATLRAELEDFQHMFLLLGGLLCSLIALVGILNFFNTMVTGIIARKREFAILQAVGMTKKQWKAMLIYEGLFYALSSVLAALLFTLVFNPFIGDLLEDMFWFFSAKFTVVPVIMTIPVFVFLGCFLPYIICGRAVKYSIVEQLS